jgi:hypothetical protein
MYFPVDKTEKEICTEHFEKSIVSHANTECPICLECIKSSGDSGANISILPCHHAMHIHCFASYIQRSKDCPICRKQMFKLPIVHTPQTIIIPTESPLGQRLQQTFPGMTTHWERQPPPPPYSRAHQRFTANNSLRHAPALREPRDEDSDVDISVEELLDHSNIHRTSGRVAGYILFVIVDLAMLSIYIISKALQ